MSQSDLFESQQIMVEILGLLCQAAISQPPRPLEVDVFDNHGCDKFICLYI